MCGLSEFKYQRDEGKDLVSIKPEHMSLAFYAAWDERKITVAAIEGGGLGFLCRSQKREVILDGREIISFFAHGQRAPEQSFGILAHLVEASHFPRANNMLAYI